MILDSRVAAPKGGHPYSFFFCSVPHTTPSYRHLPIRGGVIRFPIGQQFVFYTSPMQNNIRSYKYIIKKKCPFALGTVFF